MLKEIKTSTGLIIVFAVTVILFGGIYTYYNVYASDIPAYSSANTLIVPVAKTETQTTTTADAEPAATQTPLPTEPPATADEQIIYTNSTYGFSLVMTTSWKNYKVKEANVDGSLKSYYFELPTTDPLYAEASSTSDAGYASPFVIGVMNKADWTGAEDQVRDFGSKIGENDKYVFTLSHWQAKPTDFPAAAEQDIKTITDSFKTS